jgi:gamma-glutamylputrescine oxidase
MPDALNDSYYAATANAFERQPMLQGARKADLCVVGGGFTGLSAALVAAEAGLSVILLEAKQVGFGASGRNGGQLIAGLRWSTRELVSTFGSDRAHAIFDLAMGARSSVHDRIAKHSIACDLKRGHLEAAYKPSHFSELCREAEFRQCEFGDNSLEVITPGNMPDHVGTERYHGGLLDRNGGHFHPLNYALGLAQAGLAAGVEIFEESRVTGLVDDGTVGVSTADGLVMASHAIIACDSWTSEVVPELGRYTVPIMNYNIATQPLGKDCAHALLPSDVAVADSRFVLNYYRLSADGRMIFGGGEKYSQRPPRDVRAFVRKYMVEIFPSLETVKVDYGWGGTIGVTANRLPHFGRRGNCYFAHGFSGHGALLTTLAGELMVEAMHGTAERFDLMANLPHRAFPGGQLLRRPLATLGLLWYALRDRL